MAEPVINVLGPVALKHRGEYAAGSTYQKLDVVTYQGSSYCAKTSTTGNVPTNTDYWNLMAEKGEKGDTGDTGNDGYTPVKGTDYYTATDKAELEASLSSDVTAEVSEQLEDLTSATPLVASSTAGMTDTSRIYVNTTDGHWYWYNGASWTDGGVYQATSLKTDKTLSIENAAADSYTVGSFLGIKNKLEDVANLTEETGFYRDGVFYSNTGYLSYKYSVLPNHKYYVQTNVYVDTGMGYAQFFDSDMNYISLAESGIGEFTNAEITTPANCAYAIVVNRIGGIHTWNNGWGKLRIKNVYSDVLQNIKKLSISYISGILKIVNNENNNELVFKNFGGNNLFMINSYKVGSTSVILTTDMIPAPYTMFAVNNANGDRTGNALNYGFVGGNHQWNNSGSNSTPTAEQISLTIKCDNEVINDGDKLQANNIKIVEVNRVQANNTCLEAGNGRNVLEEKITFDFDGKHLKVNNVITPLEEIIINRYYGIQTAQMSDALYKIYSDKVYDSTSQSNVTKKPNGIIGNNIICSKLYDDDLGDYRYNTSAVKAIISNDKSYFVPIQSNQEHFTVNDVHYISGEYIFDDNVIL